MPKFALHLWAVAIAAAMSITGCEPAAPAPEASQRVFSPQDRRIARKLSLGGLSPEEAAATPADQAALCAFLVGQLQSRLDAAGAVDPTVAQAIAGVSAMYDRQIHASGVPSKSGRALAAPIPEDDRARMALGCVERLQSGG